MKNIIKLTGLITLIVFSFFYTDKVIETIRENDSLMIELERVKDIYKIEPIEGKITKKTIIPGINGRKINLEKSYKKMKELGIFNNQLIQYDIVKPKNNLENNKDKYITKGNNNKQIVSIIFILKDDKYITRLEELLKSKEVTINYFVTYSYLVTNSTYITKLENREIYNYGENGKYTPDNLIFANNLISRITKNNAIYCLTKEQNKELINLCKNNNLYTILPNIIITNNPYQEVKDNLESGSIILMEINNDTVTELGIIIDYIRGKGLKIEGLSKLLTEELN